MFGRLRERFASEIAMVDEALGRYLDGVEEPESHYGLVRYHLGFAQEDLKTLRQGRLPRGKRLRAILCMLIGKATHAPPEALTTLMVASELLHNGSLAHDDIQDGDPLRWGRATVWSRWGIPQAINVGDALVGLTFQLLLRLRDQGIPSDVVLKVNEAYVEAYLRMSEGQHLDLLHQGRLDLGVARYLDVIRRKTAAAVEGFSEAAALLGTAPEGVRSEYRHFGRAFGVLYQICDDIHAVWGNQAETGKESLRDIVTRKTTLPLLIGVERGSPRLRKLLLDTTAASFTGSDAAFIASELTNLGVREACHEHVVRYRDAALAHLRNTQNNSPELQTLAVMVKLCADAVLGTYRQTAKSTNPQTPQTFYGDGTDNAV